MTHARTYARMHAQTDRIFPVLLASVGLAQARLN